MRIGLVSFEYPPFRGGGIGTYADISAKVLAERGHDVHVISNTWGREPGTVIETTANGTAVTVHRIAALDSNFRPLGHPLGALGTHWEPALFWSVLVASKVTEIMAESPLDVIEFPECFAEGHTLLRLREHGMSFQSLPVVVTLHTPFYEHMRFNEYRLYRPEIQRRIAAEDYCIRHADRLASPSGALAEIVAKRLDTSALGRHHNPCTVIPYPLDFPDPLEPRPADDEPAPEDHSLLFVGRLEPRKGVRLLIEAAIPLFERHPGLRLTLVGRDCPAGDEPGLMSASLARRVPPRFRERVELTGELPRSELFGRYSRAVATVLPAHWDNFPFTCCEAMTRGACVVAGNAGGARELVEHGHSGMLFEAGDSRALTATIDEVLLDRALRARIRHNAPLRVREVCDPSRIAILRTELYQNAIDDRRSRLT